MPHERISLPLKLAGEVAAGVLAAHADSVDREARWPEEGLRALQAAGLGGLLVPRRLGGMGHGLLALLRVCEVLGRECGSTAICFGMHCVGSAVIAAKATPDQEERLLQPICRGEHLTTLALSEPGSGVHFYLPETELHDCGAAGYRLEGVKTFVTNGGRADSYVVSTRAVADNALGRLSCVTLPGDTPGIAWGDPWAGFGMRGNSSRQMNLTGVQLGRENLLGREGDQTWYVFEVVTPNFLMAMAGTYLGIAAAAFEVARDNLKQRRYSHSGSSLGQQPVLQHRLGQLWANLEKTRRFAYHAAIEGDMGSEEALPLLMATKAEVADCAVTLANEAMTMAGGAAYRENSRLTRLLREARASHVMSPSTDLLHLWTGRALLGLPLLAD